MVFTVLVVRLWFNYRGGDDDGDGVVVDFCGLCLVVVKAFMW